VHPQDSEAELQSELDNLRIVACRNDHKAYAAGYHACRVGGREFEFHRFRPFSASVSLSKLRQGADPHIRGYLVGQIATGKSRDCGRSDR